MAPAIEFVKDPKHLEPWALAIGKLLINFGAIEMQSINFLDCLAPNPAIYDKAVVKGLMARIELILRWIESSNLSTKLKQDAAMAWSPVEKLADLRNHIAHNSTILGWPDGVKKEGPPDLIYSFNARSVLKGQPSSVPSLIDFKELSQAMVDAEKVVTRLSELHDQIVAQINQSNP